MTQQCKYSAQVHQNDKIVVSYHSNDLYSVRNMLQALVDQELIAVEAKIIDNDLDTVVFSINKAA